VEASNAIRRLDPVAYGDQDPIEVFRRVTRAATVFDRIKMPSDFLSSLDVVRRAGILGLTDRASSVSSLLPKPFDLGVLSANTGIARAFSGSSALTAFAESQQISKWAADLGKLPVLSALELAKSNLYTDYFTGFSSQLTGSLRSIVNANASWDLQRAVEVSTRALRTVVESLPAQPGTLLLDRTSYAGSDAVATSSTVFVLAGEDPEGDQPQQGEGPLALPTALYSSLRDRLEALDPALLRRLDGAWERVNDTGADAASQACHSVQELLDGTLRCAAPDDHVLRWHAETKRDANELHNGKPTRVLRAKYLVRDRADGPAARLFLSSINGIVGVLQSGKHSLDADHTPYAAGYVLNTVEGLLGFLLTE